MNYELLNKLINTPSPSGYEYNIQRIIKKEMENKVDGFFTHPSGAMISYINNDSKNKIMMVAHADEIGLIITYIGEDGLLRTTNSGGVRPGTYVGQRVQIIHNDQIVLGVIGADKSLLDHQVEVGELLIDLGVNTKEEAEKLVSVGDYVVIDEGMHELSNNTLCGRALDDRSGVFCILKAIEELRNETSVGVYSATTVGEETTGRGAFFVPTIVKPDFAIIVDVTYAVDVYGKKELAGDIKLGDGPVITHGSIINPKLLNRVINIAKEKNIPIQHEVWAARTGTDGDHIFNFQEGIPIVLISIPLRYMHSANEVVSKNDLANTILLLKELIKSFENENIDLSMI